MTWAGAGGGGAAWAGAAFAAQRHCAAASTALPPAPPQPSAAPLLAHTASHLADAPLGLELGVLGVGREPLADPAPHVLLELVLVGYGSLMLGSGLGLAHGGEVEARGRPQAASERPFVIWAHFAFLPRHSRHSWRKGLACLEASTGH